jgi:hypothetical protein
LINVADDQVARAEEHQRVMSATAIATEQLFPGLAVRRSIEFLRCFAKDGQEDSLEKFLAELEAGR